MTIPPEKTRQAARNAENGMSTPQAGTFRVMSHTRFGKVYVEITNRCNLHCSFCHGTARPERDMSPEEFSLCLDRLHGYTRRVCLHVMGEPLFHPRLEQILSLAAEKRATLNVTTNGTLLSKKGMALLLCPAVERVNISLHSFEANGLGSDPVRYADPCFDFALKSDRVIVCLRLWNRGGKDEMNEKILERMHRFFPGDWKETRKGFKLRERVYLEYASYFDWPDLSGKEYSGDCFCYGLRDQCAVLSDGTVTPCCLDAEGSIRLGNLFDQEMQEILASERAVSLYEGFSRREAREELCRHCDYRQRYR